MKKLKSLSIFFPVYNDAEKIADLVQKADKTAKELSDDYEIICVDDGSTDKSFQVLEKLKYDFPKLKIIHHQKNKGYGGALISGFKNASKEWVFYTDGDGQYNPEELLSLVSVLDENIDVVNGYKINRSDPILRKIFGTINNFLIHLFFPIPISDIDCDFRLIKSSILKSIKLNSVSGTICAELILKLKKQNARFAEVGVHHYKRKFGKSEFFKLPKILETIFDNVKLFVVYKSGQL